jgi:hypothetical protein
MSGTINGTTRVDPKWPRYPSERSIGDERWFGVDATHIKSPIASLIRAPGRLTCRASSIHEENDCADSYVLIVSAEGT